MPKSGRVRLKVRGIEMRRSDTPELISNLQDAMPGKLAGAGNASGFEEVALHAEYVNEILLNEIKLGQSTAYFCYLIG